MSETKVKVGLSMLSDTRQGEFDSCVDTLIKVLSKPIADPDPKFRRLRKANARISSMLSTRGVKAILLGSGWEEEQDEFVLPEAADDKYLQIALDGIASDRELREKAAAADKLNLQESRRAEQDKENEQRKVMKMQIVDDAQARKEPGWTAKAAGVKGGRAITSCSDIGAQGGGG